jgi:hypothetical protein
MEKYCIIDVDHICSYLGQLKLEATFNYWTSGLMVTSEKLGKWCFHDGSANSSITMPGDLNWLQNSSTSSCVTFEMSGSKSGLKFGDCREENFFVCEVSFSIKR